MAAAAEQALARGDLQEAGLAYLDAAWIAQEQNNPRQVWELGHRAEMLADSPLLGAADRAAILDGSAARRRECSWRCGRRSPERAQESH